VSAPARSVTAGRDLVPQLFSNPELIRNVRTQLRRGRMLAAAGICASISLTLGYAFHAGANPTNPGVWAREWLTWMVGIQAVVLAIGGGIACVQAISREKELNTFDFQRVTRLTPLELAMGKLFGAPAQAYFVFLCFMPAALMAAALGKVRPSFLIAAYVFLILNSITFHAVSLVMSLVIERAASAGAALLLLLMVGFSNVPGFGIMELGPLSPLYADVLILESDWGAFWRATSGVSVEFDQTSVQFFGTAVPHPLAAAVIFVTFTGWMVLALVRNIKRDPAVYELYSPGQFLGLILYANTILIGFFAWRRFSPLTAQASLLVFNVLLMGVLGLALLRNRDQVRRRLRELGAKGASWAEAAWPAPYLVAGFLLVGPAVNLSTQWMKNAAPPWDLGLAFFRVAFIALWMVRDTLFLQWMNLRRLKRPLPMGMLYLMVFYLCATIFSAMLDLYGAAGVSALMPMGVLGLEPAGWARDAMGWNVALLAQLVPIAIFVNLLHDKLEELAK